MKELKKIVPLLVFVNLLLVAGDAIASTSTGMPWEGPLSQLLTSLEGPVARVLGAVSIIALGLGLAFSEGGSFMKKALWVAMGLSIAFNATSWGLSFFGFGGGLLV
ncbi:MAG: TrbC/VirB2 family protein [Desulfobulbaceae bacterium]|nr:TrbC/VirB2 family protein [Desulfobulbaceae bacterium]